MPTHIRRALLLPLLAGLLAATGCAGNRSVVIPAAEPPSLEGRSPVPAAVGVLYGGDTPGRLTVHVVEGPEGKTTWSFPVGDALVDGYEALLPRLFQRAERVATRSLPAGATLDGTLEIVLDDVQVSMPGASETGACRVAVAESFTLRDRSSAVVAAWSAAGEGSASRGATVDCGGAAASGALRMAEEGMIRGLAGRGEVKGWLAGLGRTWTDMPASPAPERPLARASDAEEVEEPARRVFGVYGGAGYFFGQPTDGLPTPQGGLALAIGGAWRPLHWLGVALEAQNLSSSIAGVDLNQTLLAVLVRLAWPVWVLEPWVGVGPLVDFAASTRFTTSPGGFATRETATQFAPGGLAAAGVDVVLVGRVEVGARWQWHVARVDVPTSAGTTSQANAGGQALLVSGGYFWP